MAQESQSNTKATTAHVPKPFGTHSEKYTYSQFSHLRNEDKGFALDLAVTEPLDLAPLMKEVKEAAAKSKVVLKAGELKELLGQTEEGIEPCTRKECVTIVRKILETQGRNKAERNDILATEDMLMHEITSAEQDSTMLEEELAVANNESKRLELTLSHLQEELTKLTKSCRDLQHERDEFSNKVMVIETDRQRWVRKLQLADSALQDCIWRGVTSVNASQLASDDHEQSMMKQFIIKQTNPEDIRESESVSGTDYKRLVKSDMLDITEYTPIATRSSNASVSSLPNFIQQQLGMAASKSRTMPNYLSSGSAMSSSVSLDGRSLNFNGGSSVMSGLTTRSAATAGGGRSRNRFFANTHAHSQKGTRSQSSRQLPSLNNDSNSVMSAMTSDMTADHSRRSKSNTIGLGSTVSFKTTKSDLRSGTYGKHTNPADGSIDLNLRNDAYKGYTPTGSPTFKKSSAERTMRLYNPHTGRTKIKTAAPVSFEGGETGKDDFMSISLDDPLNSNSNKDDEIGEEMNDGTSISSVTNGTGPTLAPVFYNETARASWGREKSLGKVRTRDVTKDRTMKHNRRKLLTSTGHPDVFLNNNTHTGGQEAEYVFY